MAAKLPSRTLTYMGVLSAVLILGGFFWRHALVPEATLLAIPSESVRRLLPTLHHPVIETLKLVSAFLIGNVLTAVHKSTRGGEAPLSRPMEHAQILLCLSGALMMIIIGDSLARAFGIAGAASIIRFRTPVEDPKDTIILFLMLGLGMAAGLGAFALAGLGTIVVSIALLYLGTSADDSLITMALTLGAQGAEFPTARVEEVLSRNGIKFEPRGVTDGPEASVRYRVFLERGVSLDQVTAELKAGSGGIRTVVWDTKKKRD